METTYTISENLQKVLNLIQKLTQKEKKILSEELKRENAKKEFQRLLKKFKTDEISEEDILREVETVRQERYDQEKN